MKPVSATGSLALVQGVVMVKIRGSARRASLAFAMMIVLVIALIEKSMIVYRLFKTRC